MNRITLLMTFGMLLFAQSVLAQVVTVDVKVTAVDPQSRGIMVSYKTDIGNKTATLDVSRRATITINGKEGSLEDLMPGHEARVAYHKELAVIIKIDANGNPAVDADKLEGEWVVIDEELNGTKMTTDEVRTINQRISIHAGKLSMTRVVGGRFGRYEGTLKLDPNTDPKRFTFSGKNPGDKPVEWLGIYEIDEDSLKLCYKYAAPNGETTRPTTFETAPSPGSPFVLLNMKRDALATAAREAAKKEMKLIDGNWMVVAEELNGRRLTRTQLTTQNRRLKCNDGKLVMSRVIAGRLGSYEGRFTLDPSGDPKQFDFDGTSPGGKPVQWVGIYQLEDDSLTLCYKYVAIEGRTVRPVEFKTETNPDAPFVMITLKREPE